MSEPDPKRGAYVCKLGTMPAVIWAVDRRTPLEVGRTVRIKTRSGERWKTVRVTRVDPDGYFMADLL